LLDREVVNHGSVTDERGRLVIGGRWRHVPITGLLLVFGALYASGLSRPAMFMWDEAEYASIGRSVVRGEGFAISGAPNRLRPPVLPLAVGAAIRGLGTEADVVARAVVVVFSLLALLALYACLAVQSGAATGLVAAALLGMAPEFWTSTTLVLAEIPFLAFFTPAVLALYLGLYRDARWFYPAWVAFALALLARYTAVLFGPIALAFVVVAYLSGDPSVRARLRSPHFWLTPLVAALALAPWLIRQHVVFGDALVGVRQASRQLPVYAPYLSMPWHFYLTHVPWMLSPLSAAAVIVGAAWAGWRRDRFGLHCLGVAAGILVWFSVYRYKETRLVIAALPFMTVLAALALARLASPLGRRLWATIVGVALTALLIANFVVVRDMQARRVVLGEPSFLEAMRFLRETTAPDTVVIGANYPQIAWYADRRAVDLPEDTALPAALAGAGWVVVTNFERGQRPYARALPERITPRAPGDRLVFRDERFVTILIRAPALADALRGTP
jgi:4-amino-4-deoxy-L-arabinose transferase-like glycosyltransferase